MASIYMLFELPLFLASFRRSLQVESDLNWPGEGQGALVRDRVVQGAPIPTNWAMGKRRARQGPSPPKLREVVKAL